jgi:FlaA1/EpsC-like NDP-sugar epimerase
MKMVKVLFPSFLKKTVFKRRIFFFVSDVLLISFSLYASFWLRFNGVIPSHYKTALPYFIFLALVLKLPFIVFYNLYDISWRFVSLGELIKLAKALLLGSLALGMALFIVRTSPPLRASPFPRSVLLVDFMFSLFLIGLLRIGKRVSLEGLKGTLRLGDEKVKTLIIGAGNAGEQIVREMTRNKNTNYFPIGFVDDDTSKQGIIIHGVKVLGTRKDIPDLVKEKNVDEILIALPSAPSRDVRDMVQIARKTKLKEKIKILPSTIDLIGGKVTLSDIQDVKVEDLLGRIPVKIHFEAIKEFIQGKKVLLTGAGGSIGSELAKSIVQFDPKRLIILDIDDSELFGVVNNLKFSPSRITPAIGDIKDKSRMRYIFEKFSPQIVLHSAAYKHVPILEFYPEEAVKTNVLGTKMIAELSIQHGIEKFIFISTDKAVNPTSVMGVTKRAGEELLKALNHKNITKFISVRFGNVLGSRGSVVPLFMEQIKKRSAVTVTHPEMKRYFMIISEAVMLVLEASALGEGGEVFVLDMGEPVKIIDLAKEMIRLSGLEPDKDIPIEIGHIRPGEKLFEELLSAEEGSEPTAYEKVFKVNSPDVLDPNSLIEKIENLITLSYQLHKKHEIIELLKEIIPQYTPMKHDMTIRNW